MTAPLITVVVPGYNGERHLGEALASVIAQPWRPLEVVVADDGSADGTVALAGRFGAPVRVVSQRRGGPAAARNLGIGAAQGAFISFIDQDDLWLPHKLSLQMAAFDADPTLEVCVGHVQRFHDDAGRRVLRDRPVPGYLSTTMLARRAAFDRVGLFDVALEYSDSADWFLRGRAVGLEVRLLPDLLTLHRDHADSYSLSHGDQSRQEFLGLIKAKLDRERE